MRPTCPIPGCKNLCRLKAGRAPARVCSMHETRKTRTGSYGESPERPKGYKLKTPHGGRKPGPLTICKKHRVQRVRMTWKPPGALLGKLYCTRCHNERATAWRRRNQANDRLKQKLRRVRQKALA